MGRYTNTALMLETMLGLLPSGLLHLHLYRNTHTQTASDTEADYIEVADPDYKPEKLVPERWIVSSGPRSIASHSRITFNLKSYRGKVAGYYLTTPSNDLVWAESFPEPFDIEPGDKLAIDPKIMLG